MAISTKPRPWTVSLAGRVMDMTSLDGLTIEDVKHLAARILDDEEYAPKDNLAQATTKMLNDYMKSAESTEPEPPMRGD